MNFSDLTRRLNNINFNNNDYETCKVCNHNRGEGESSPFTVSEWCDNYYLDDEEYKILKDSAKKLGIDEDIDICEKCFYNIVSKSKNKKLKAKFNNLFSIKDYSKNESLAKQLMELDDKIIEFFGYTNGKDIIKNHFYPYSSFLLFEMNKHNFPPLGKLPKLTYKKLFENNYLTIIEVYDYFKNRRRR